MVAPWLKLLIDSRAFEFGWNQGNPYLWSVGDDYERCQTSSQWTQNVLSRHSNREALLTPTLALRTVKNAFKKYSPNKTPCPPKLLRSYAVSHRTALGIGH